LHVQALGELTGTATSVYGYDASHGNVVIDDAAHSGGGKPAIPIPTFNFANLRQVAQTSGNYISSSTTFNNETITGGSAGLTYVEGDVTFRGACTIVGGFVAKGSITLNNGNSLTQTQDAGNRFPIFMSKEGDMIRLYGLFSTGTSNIVFATNNIKIQTPGGESVVLGCVVCGGSFEIVANNDLTVSYVKVIAPEVVPSGIEIISWNR
jgi:hypothetical protein